MGRPFDVTDESVIIDGETSDIFISRKSLRKVTLCGGLGGPRKEFLNDLIKEIRENMINESDKIMIKNTEYIAEKYYFAAGIAIGEFTNRRDISHNKQLTHN